MHLVDIIESQRYCSNSGFSSQSKKWHKGVTVDVRLEELQGL